MASLFSASNFVIVSSTVDFSGAPISNSVVYTCPANKYCDFYVRNFRAIGNNCSYSLFAGWDDGIGGTVASPNIISQAATLTVSSNSPASVQLLSQFQVESGASLLNPVQAESQVTGVGTYPGTAQAIVGHRSPTVRLLAGDKILITASFNAGGTLRFGYKVIEYSST